MTTTALLAAALLLQTAAPGRAPRSAPAPAPAAPVPIATTAAARRVLSDVRYLADDAREGRGVGTRGLAASGDYLAAAFRAAGPALRVSFQSFTISPDAPVAMHTGLGGKETRNVVAILPGSSPALRGQVLVIGAHYDHLGLGGADALDDPDSTGRVHNGADDNASGTAALLEVARRLAAHPPARTVVFVAFSAEEEGDLGSAYFVRHPVPQPIDSVYAMVNMDMVGRLRAEQLTALGAATAKEFLPLLDSLNTPPRFDLRASGDGWGPSDHQSFFAAKRPVLHFFTELHEDYHRTTDDWQKINADGIVQVAEFVTDLARALGNRAGPLTFVDAPPPAPPTGGGGYGAYLGTIPDMTESPGGARISGVRAGGPADKAGLQGGDVITRIGDKVVANLYDMTAALRSHQEGDTVEIVVKRGAQELHLTAVLGRRR